jgi:hypothetical protein
MCELEAQFGKGSKSSLMFSGAEAKCLKVNKLWRKRVGVEPTIRPAKDRIAGFEGREDHRTPFASVESIGSGANCFNWRSRGLRADQSSNKVIELWAGAYFVVGMCGRRANLAAWKKLAGETFAQNEQFH